MKALTLNAKDRHKITADIYKVTELNPKRLSKILRNLTLDDTIRKRYEVSKDALLKLLILGKLKGIKFDIKLVDYLKTRPDEALDLGFYKGENGNVKLPDRRTLGLFRKNLTKDESALVGFVAKTIEDALYTKGTFLDLSCARQEPEKEVLSKSAIYKATQEKTKELSRMIKKTLLKQLKDRTKYNSIYKDEEFLDLLIHISLSQDFAKEGAKVLRTLKDSKVPVGATLFYYLKKYSLEEVSNVFAKIFDITFSMAEKAGLLSRMTKHTIAIDCHEWFYYGKQIEGGFVVGKKPGRGTLRCFKFITLDIVDKECRFTLLALPVIKSKDEQVTQVDLVKRLIERALGKIKIWRVLMDRGFLGADIINFLKSKGLEFIIPAKSSNKATVNSKLLEPNPVAVIKGEMMGNSRVNLIVIKEYGHRYGFFTNIETGLDDDKMAMGIADFYSRRWQIETGYRVKKYAFRGKTTSRKYIIRYIYFMLSVVLYNFWILINGLLIFELNLKGDKPILSAKVFDAILYKTRALEDIT